MQNEEFEITPELRAAMNDLLRAASHFALVANQQYSKIEPKSAIAYAELWRSGAAITDIRVQLTPDERRVATGFTTVADSRWRPIITLDAQSDGQVPSAH